MQPENETIYINESQLKPDPRNPNRSAHQNMFGQEYIGSYVLFLMWDEVQFEIPERVPYVIHEVEEKFELRQKQDLEENEPITRTISKRELKNEDGTEIIRNVKRERQDIQNYLLSQRPQYRSVLEEESKDFPMHRKCRASIVMAAHDEENNIYTSLESIATQMSPSGETLEPESYEIIVINAGAVDYKPDLTYEKIKQFKEAYPDINLVVKNVIFPDITVGGLGMAYKFGHDLALQRSFNRTDQDEPFYVSSKVADMPEIDPDLFQEDIKTLDAKPYLDAVCAIRDYDPKTLMHHDLAFLSIRSIEIAGMLLRDYHLRPENNANYSFHNSVVTAASNTTISANAYALMGGYLSGNQGGDYDITKRLAYLRSNYTKNGILIPNTHTVEITSSHVSESPRRLLYNLLQQTNSYDKFADPDVTKLIRTISLEQFLQDIPGKNISEDQIALFENVFTRAYDYFRTFVSESTVNETNDSWRDILFKRLMTAMGFKKHRIFSGIVENGTMQGKEKDGWMLDYRLDSTVNDKDEIKTTVKILNLGNIQSALQKYREKHIS